MPMRSFFGFFFFLFTFSLSAQEVSRPMASSKRAKHRLLSKNGEVLMYSDEFDPNQIKDEMPLALQEIIRAYKSKAEHGARRYSTRTPGKVVAPLLKSVRHQGEPYNRSCPYYRYQDGTLSKNPCVSGCVATALEQVVSFWRHPSELKDTLKGWSTDNYTIPDVLPGTKIDWDNILTNYADGQYNDVQAKAIADLTYYLGVGVHMNWGVESSGANLYRSIDALYDAFDYKTIAYVQRGLYSPQAWNRMLRNELECGRPIVYTGHTYSLAGHCFNIDGVDEEGYYHINWGEKNYTCYLDMDYMNPFEPLDELTDMGMQAGLFNNQTALFMHPDDFLIDIFDTLSVDDALHGVVVDDIKLSRAPDRQGYIRTDFSLTNTNKDSVNYTFEVLTYLPTDTAIFKQADFVGLTSVNLAPGEHKVWPVYCLFSKTGDRLLSYSADDKTTPYVVPVTIVDGTPAQYEFKKPEVQLIKYRDANGMTDYTARFDFDVLNNSTSGAGSYLFTYCLFEDGNERDVRHYNIPDVYAGVPFHESVDFHHLKEGQQYRFIVRYPWTIRQEITFVVRDEDCVDGIEVVAQDDELTQYLPQAERWKNRLYDLSGRRVQNPVRSGLYIRNGKLWMNP